MGGITWQQMLVAVLTAFATVVASWLVSRSGIKAKRIESASSPYDQLAGRVVTLEKQVDDLREEVRILRDRNEELTEENERILQRAAAQRRLAVEADDYITDLHVRWDTHRVKPRPPYWRWLGPTTPPTLD